MATLASAKAGLKAGAGRARKTAGASAALRAALTPFLAAKAVAIFVPILVVWSTSQTPGHPSYQEITQTFGYWDGRNYIDIAEKGYPSGPLDLIPGHPGHLWGFFPGLPILLKAFSFVFRDTITSGIVINTIGEFFALFFLARLVLLERNGDAGAARFACWLLAFWPDAVYLTVVYTDSVFMASAIASLYYMRRGDYGRASIAAGIAVFMRITGVILVPVLLADYIWRRRRVDTGVAGILCALAPLLIFAQYAASRTGDFFAYNTVQHSVSYGSRSFVPPWTGLRTTWETATGGGPAGYNFLFLSDVVWGVAGFALLVLFAANWRRIPWQLTLFSAGVWVLITSFTFWQGLMRYEMAMIPIYLVGADLWRKRPQLATVVLSLSAAWMVVQTYTFATGRFGV